MVIEDEADLRELLDLMLPGADGFEVCRRLKTQSETRDVPVIILTARG